MLRPIESDDFLSSARIGDHMIASAMVLFLRRIADCCGKWLCLKKEMMLLLEVIIGTGRTRCLGATSGNW